MPGRLFVAVMLGFFFLTLNCNCESNNEAEIYLLPGNIVPIHYDLRLNTHMNDFDEDIEQSYVYDGKIDITMVPVRENVTEIIINSHDTLEITKTVLTAKAGLTKTELGTGMYDPKSQKLLFPLKSPLPRNESVTLTLSFTGKHSTVKYGFYRSFYQEKGIKKIVLNTEFQPCFTRVAFPCFDEPKYKATFNVSVSVPNNWVRLGYKAMSNTALKSTEQTNVDHVYHFEKTPLPISSYLIAVLVSDYESTGVRYFNSTYPGSAMRKPKEFRTWGRPSNIHNGGLAQVAGTALMDIYKNDYKIGYGFNKLDQVAVDNFPGGMENWGLVFYWASILTSIELNKVGIVTLIAHELGHQWFGDLVTCHWWSDIWLNEGFATYVEFFGADKIRTPELNTSAWMLPYEFLIDIHQNTAFQEDVPGLTHPLTVEIYDPQEIACYFDTIEYEKAGSVIRMWTHVLGLEAFNKAVGYYMMRNKESISTPESLLSSFDVFANESKSDLQGDLPSKLFKNWHTQGGYPVVQVHLHEHSFREFKLTQEVFRYRYHPEDVRVTWNIPITYSTDKFDNFNQTQASHWLKEKDSSLSLTVKERCEWIVVNNQESGYYRVNYDSKNWKSLFNVLTNPDKMKSIHEMNRAQIIDDVANLARSTADTYVSYNFFMNLTYYLENEKSYFPWRAGLNNFKYLDRMLAKDQTTHSLFKKHILKISRNRYEALLHKSLDNFIDKKLRSEIMSWSCKMGHLGCIKDVKTFLMDCLGKRNCLNENFGTGVYCSAVREDDGTMWDILWENYSKSENATDKSALISGLTCTRNPENMATLLEISVHKNKVIDVNEREDLLFSTIRNGDPENVKLLLKFFTDNFERIHDIFGKSQIVDSMLKELATRLGTDEEVAEMEAWITSIRRSGKSKLCEKSALNILELLYMNNEWLKKRMPDVKEWLLSHYN